MVKEYEFWMNKRSTPCGLNRYFHHADADYLRAFPKIIAGRVPFSWNSDVELLEHSAHYLAEAESGWDFNPRFGGRCTDFAPVDLNSILYACEEFLSAAAARLNRPAESREWQGQSKRRRERMYKLLWDEKQGMYFDYDFVHDRRSPIPSAAAFVALWAGAAEPDQALAIKQQLPRFLGPYGLAATPELVTPVAYQWMFPVMWPPLVAMTASGLARYGFDAEAELVAGLYLDTVAATFAATGRLWEKYDVRTGEADCREYSSTRMMGWTAGAFAFLLRRFACRHD